MSEFSEAYRQARNRIGELALGLSDEERALSVPACPAWTTKDLVAHVAGIAADMLQGNVAAAGSQEWTEAQIATRRDRSLSDIVAEWDETGPQVEGALEFIHPAAAGATVGDLVTHEHDLRGAIGRPGSRDSEGVSLALDTYVRWLGRRIREAGLPTLEVGSDGRSWRAGKEEPAGSVSGAPFDLLRSLTGRRTTGEIRELDWSVDPTPYLDVFSAYGLPERSLDE
ncbi:MAG: maleylpyruvate isomerase family mycothiol-dependent enzyme [Actinomycetota bacterium]|nr:maleylpyruvate isomerase family mycothiol-dependent enzyme [Actinomycetota bacterium]